MEQEKQFTIKVFTENQIGLSNRITGILTRRRMNIVSMSVKEADDTDIHQYTIVIKDTKERIDKVVKQIEKQVDVLRAFAQYTK